MGFSGRFAQQQSETAHVRLGSKADINRTFNPCPLYPQKQTSLGASGCLLRELGSAHRRYNDRFSELQLQTSRPACVFSARLCWLVLDSCPLATGGINLSAVSFPPAFGQCLLLTQSRHRWVLMACRQFSM